MRRYSIAYTERARTSIRHLPPLVKPAIKRLIEKLAEDPFAGKPLKAELTGFWSYRHQRWRVLYIVQKERRAIEILLVEKRESVYEILKELSH